MCAREEAVSKTSQWLQSEVEEAKHEVDVTTWDSTTKAEARTTEICRLRKELSFARTELGLEREANDSLVTEKEQATFPEGQVQAGGRGGAEGRLDPS